MAEAFIIVSLSCSCLENKTELAKGGAGGVGTNDGDFLKCIYLIANGEQFWYRTRWRKDCEMCQAIRIAISVLGVQTLCSARAEMK